MAVAPRGVLPGGSAGVVEERRLREQHVRTLGVTAFPGSALRFGDLLQRPADVDRGGTAAVRRAPGNRSVESPVELEDARPVPVAAKRMSVVSGQLVAGDAKKLSRHDVGHDDIRSRQLVNGALGADLAAELFETIGQCVGEPLRPSARKTPAEDVRRGH